MWGGDCLACSDSEVYQKEAMYKRAEGQDAEIKSVLSLWRKDVEKGSSSIENKNGGEEVNPSCAIRSGLSSAVFLKKKKVKKTKQPGRSPSSSERW